ncbi:MAG: histidine phosphatase family protein [Verrucomicrobia bacterium]|nr:histidine phosphatase family protein [Verrucomicrobiota bacterium]MBS0636326.1 histidine phosphatase family protein [Verrucomicrobiota bacterium]
MAILAILVRHAKPRDSDGALSESGIMMQKKVSSYLKKEFEITPNEIWTSPILRAKQTADLIGEEFGLTPQEELVLGELDMFDEFEVTQKIATLPDESTVIIVTHAPQIMRLSTHWAGHQVFAGTPPTSAALFYEFPEKVVPGTGRFVRLVSYSDTT